MSNDSLAQLGAGEEYELRPADPDRGNWDAKTTAWRLQRFIKMDFDLDQAEELAASWAWTGDVEQLLAAGCNHQLAHAIAT
jgi:hypothetical protein